MLIFHYLFIVSKRAVTYCVVYGLYCTDAEVIILTSIDVNSRSIISSYKVVLYRYGNLLIVCKIVMCPKQ